MRSAIITIMAVLLCGYHTYAQNKARVPERVFRAFAKKHATATHVKWEMEGDRYESSFTEYGKKMSALWTAQGALVETETTISIADLPAGARLVAQERGRIRESARIVTADGRVQYEAEVKGRDLIFDEYGHFIEERSGKD